jgi:hypothetical protein
MHRRSCLVLLAALVGACNGEFDGRASLGNNAPGDTTVSLEIAPQDPVLAISRQSRPTLAFKVTAHRRDGSSADLTANVLYQVSLPIGTIDRGTFTPSGTGGQARVRASLGGTSSVAVETSLTVHVHEIVNGPGAMGVAPSSFEGGAAMMPPQIDYPLDAAVMPENVPPPRIMWTPKDPMVAPTDLYRVRLVRPHVTIEGVLLASAGFNYAWDVPADVWQELATTDVGSPIELRVAVRSGARAVESAPLTFRTVNAVIAGNVYYWSPPQARLFRVNVAQATTESFLPTPGTGCIGCHTVGRDGTRLTGFLEQPGETLAAFDLTTDLTANPAPSLFKLGYPARRCGSYNPQNTRIVAGDCGANVTSMTFSIIDTSTGRTKPELDGQAGDGYDPEWTPDGTQIAFTSRANDLMVTDVYGDRFGTPRLLHPAASSPDGTLDWHPTWSPDSSWIAFQHGDCRRTAVALDDKSAGHGALWLLSRGGGTPIKLDHALGPAPTAGGFRPVFSPFNSGGYYWLLYTSLRPYGNATAGVQGQKQIWVVAVKNQPGGGGDPSEVPYYLAGQDPQTALSPYWTAPSCRKNGDGCEVGTQCCSGTCEPDMGSEAHCKPPRGQCTTRGAVCGGSADCCAGLSCTPAKICDLAGPG